MSATLGEGSWERQASRTAPEAQNIPRFFQLIEVIWSRPRDAAGEINTFEGLGSWRMLVTKENMPCQPTN